MDIFSNRQKSILAEQNRLLKKELKQFKAKRKTQKKYKVAITKRTGSTGERLIEDYLIQNSLVFIREHPIPEISDFKDFPLRFDFFLPELVTVIEFDGEQHFKPSKRFDTKKSTLQSRQEKDRRKDFYCQTKGWDIIRINYMEIGKVKQILDDRIKI